MRVLGRTMGERSDSWQLTGKYRAMIVRGGMEDLARGVVNLVNVQGPGLIEVSPLPGEALECQLNRLDPEGLWRKWWLQAAGEAVSFTSVAQRRYPPPEHRLPSDSASATKCLALNIGGHYVRIASMVGATVLTTDSIRIGTGTDSLLSGATLDKFVRILDLEERARSVECVGIAWSAPRTALGLRAMSLQMSSVGDVAPLLHAGDVDEILSKRCGRPVMSWNDGEAAAAGEFAAQPRSDRSLLVLKLGTSFASGLATLTGVSSLPMQLAKCVLRVKPLIAYEHPVVGLRGTARDLLGAQPLQRTYRTITGNSTASYDDLCLAATHAEPSGTRVVRRSARAIAELAALISDIWSAVDVVITGKNVAAVGFRDLLLGYVTEELSAIEVPAQLLAPLVEPDMASAVGAGLLSISRFETFSDRNNNREAR
jgi:predicted NBD/HSP70 family sugar kinase